VADKDLMTYCHRDTEIIERAMDKWYNFIKQEDLGNFGLTLSSQAFNAFRHRFMDTKIYVHREGQPVNLERSGYFGGRVECFFLGKAPVKPYLKIDINSQYPFVMRQYEYPYRFCFRETDLSFITLRKWLRFSCVMARVVIDTDEPCYPYRGNERTIFPVGRFETTLSTPELIYAYEHHHLVKIIEGARYDKTYIFKDYVDYMYIKRQEFKRDKNIVYEHSVKILLNSLYGKFGQKLRETEYKPVKDNQIVNQEFVYDMRDNTTKRVVTFGGREKTTTINYIDSYNAMTAISAHVTAYARMYLWDFIKRAPDKKLYYCDTDSLIIDKEILPLYENELHSSRLGAFKIEEESKRLEIRGLKHYLFAKDWKIKGISKKAEKLAENVFLTDQWPGFSLVFKRKLTQPYVVQKVQKNLTGEYTKGIVKSNGWVEPLELHNLNV